MQWIEINGGSLRYELTGAGPATIVLVHEMGGTLESWDEVVPLLHAGRRILRFDVRGFGASSKISGTADIEGLVEDLRALLDALGITTPVAIAGCAVGGAIALRFAACHPDRTEALIAMGPATGVAPERRQATLDRARLAEEQGMLPGTDALLDATWPDALRADRARFASYRAKWLSNDPHSYAAINRMLAGLEMTADFAAISCPTLFLAGQHDQLRPPSSIEALSRQIANARFTSLDTGHFMAVQTPALVAAAFNDFLAARATPPKGV
jgi:pimeloyl-ACP methyl ester carboxylesterase